MIKRFSGGSVTYSGGSEVLVLGYGPTDNHSENFWEELASVELNATASQLNSGTFTAKKYLWGQIYAKGAGSINPNLQFNGSTSGYASRYSQNGGGDGTDTGNAIINNTNDGSENSFINFFIINDSANQKLIISHEVNQKAVGTAFSGIPSRNATVGKWDRISGSGTGDASAQITRITTKSAGTYAIGSIIKVWGHN